MSALLYRDNGIHHENVLFTVYYVSRKRMNEWREQLEARKKLFFLSFRSQNHHSTSFPPSVIKGKYRKATTTIEA